MARGVDARRVAVRRHWREPEARILVEACRSSGERLGVFARRHELKPRVRPQERRTLATVVKSAPSARLVVT